MAKKTAVGRRDKKCGRKRGLQQRSWKRQIRDTEKRRGQHGARGEEKRYWVRYRESEGRFHDR